MEKLRIIFMGTPDFAVGILEAIYLKNYEIAAVITAPDKPAGRGQKLKYSAVKEYALEKNLYLLQPTNLKNEQFLEELKILNANLNIVVAFRMLPEAVWKMPRFGTFNLHASLLPQYRGAAPINWAIINGETITGVTTFFIDDKIDTGAMILRKEIGIGLQETAGELHDRLMELGKGAVIETLERIQNSTIIPEIQEDYDGIKTAHKLTKENCKIDWTKPGEDICNLIRGLSPYPAAWCSFLEDDKKWDVKIYEAEFLPGENILSIGQITTDKKHIYISVAGGSISIRILQFPGKKRMNAAEFLNGMQFTQKAMAY